MSRSPAFEQPAMAPEHKLGNLSLAHDTMPQVGAYAPPSARGDRSIIQSDGKLNFNYDIYPNHAQAPVSAKEFQPVLDKAKQIHFTTAPSDKAGKVVPDYILGQDGKLRQNPEKKTPNKDGSVNIELQSANKSETAAKKAANDLQRAWAQDMITRWQNSPDHKGEAVPPEWQDLVTKQAEVPTPAPPSPSEQAPPPQSDQVPQPDNGSSSGGGGGGGSGGGGSDGGGGGGGSSGGSGGGSDGGGGGGSGGGSGGGGSFGGGSGDSSAGGSPSGSSPQGGSIDLGSVKGLPNINQDLGNFYQYPLTGGVTGNPERIDQGVDFGGSGQFHAIGNSTVDAIIPNWYQGQPLIELTLNDGPLKGEKYFVAEGIDPLVKVGDNVQKGQVIANITGGPNGIETGWGAGQGTTLARATTGYTEGQQTPAGQSYSAFLQKLGGPGGRTA